MLVCVYTRTPYENWAYTRCYAIGFFFSFSDCKSQKPRLRGTGMSMQQTNQKKAGQNQAKRRMNGRKGRCCRHCHRSKWRCFVSVFLHVDRQTIFCVCRVCVFRFCKYKLCFECLLDLSSKTATNCMEIFDRENNRIRRRWTRAHTYQTVHEDALNLVRT